MIFKPPKDNEKYHWTNHVKGKMVYYRLSESLIKRIVRFPKRVEEGIAPGTTAVMQPAGSKKRPQEIWVMYVKAQSAKRKAQSEENETENGKKSKILRFSLNALRSRRIRVISAWRYPGVSPVGKPVPIPEEILQELSSLIE